MLALNPSGLGVHLLAVIIGDWSIKNGASWSLPIP